MESVVAEISALIRRLTDQFDEAKSVADDCEALIKSSWQQGAIDENSQELLFYQLFEFRYFYMPFAAMVCEVKEAQCELLSRMEDRSSQEQRLQQAIAAGTALEESLERQHHKVRQTQDSLTTAVRRHQRKELELREQVAAAESARELMETNWKEECDRRKHLEGELDAQKEEVRALRDRVAELTEELRGKPSPAARPDSGYNDNPAECSFVAESDEEEVVGVNAAVAPMTSTMNEPKLDLIDTPTRPRRRRSFSPSRLFGSLLHGNKEKKEEKERQKRERQAEKDRMQAAETDDKLRTHRLNRKLDF